MLRSLRNSRKLLGILLTLAREDALFVFDDFNVEELVADVTPPQLVGIKVIDDFSIAATFSEALAINSALMVNNYVLKEGNENPIFIIPTALSNVVILNFLRPFKSGNYSLMINGVKDLKGNSANNVEASTFYIQPYTAVQGDLVINIASIPIEENGKSNMLKLSYVE